MLCQLRENFSDTRIKNSSVSTMHPVIVHEYGKGVFKLRHVCLPKGSFNEFLYPVTDKTPYFLRGVKGQ